VDRDAGVELLSAPIALYAEVAASALAEPGWSQIAYNDLYGSDSSDLDRDEVIELVEAELQGAGWKMLERSTWEGGLEDVLVRRGNHCLVASYDPFTRQLSLADGKPHLSGLIDMLGQEGAITMADDGSETVDTSPEIVEQWGLDTLTAVHDHLRGHITDMPHLATPVQATLLGLHPHADGTLRAPGSDSLVTAQLRALLSTVANAADIPN
jgi:hypothetical protein